MSHVPGVAGHVDAGGVGAGVMGTWWKRRAAGVLLGPVTGAGVGFAVYHASRLSGASLFIVCGGFAGLVAALVVHSANQTVRLTDVKVTVPQFSELSFTVTRDSEQVAWKLFVETVTRISTQRLDMNGGLVREALTSLYSLFASTRDILKQSQPSRLTGTGPTVEQLAIAMLNTELRPFLTRWHPRLRRWEADHDDGETGWPDNDQCRSELAATQQRLQAYVLGFGKLARLPNAQQIVDGTFGSQFARSSVTVPAQTAGIDSAGAGIDSAT